MWITEWGLLRRLEIKRKKKISLFSFLFSFVVAKKSFFNATAHNPTQPSCTKNDIVCEHILIFIEFKSQKEISFHSEKLLRTYVIQNTLKITAFFSLLIYFAFFSKLYHNSYFYMANWWGLKLSSSIHTLNWTLFSFFFIIFSHVETNAQIFRTELHSIRFLLFSL